MALEINSLQVGSLLSEYVTLGYNQSQHHSNTHHVGINVHDIPPWLIVPRKEHRPMPVPDAGLRFQNIGDDSSDSGIDHILDW